MGPNVVLCSDNVVEQGTGRTAGAASLECRRISPFSMNLASFVLVVDRKNLRRQVAWHVWIMLCNSMTRGSTQMLMSRPCLECLRDSGIGMFYQARFVNLVNSLGRTTIASNTWSCTDVCPEIFGWTRIKHEALISVPHQTAARSKVVEHAGHQRRNPGLCSQGASPVKGGNLKTLWQSVAIYIWLIWPLDPRSLPNATCPHLRKLSFFDARPAALFTRRWSRHLPFLKTDSGVKQDHARKAFCTWQKLMVQEAHIAWFMRFRCYSCPRL